MALLGRALGWFIPLFFSIMMVILGYTYDIIELVMIFSFMCGGIITPKADNYHTRYVAYVDDFFARRFNKASTQIDKFDK